MPSTLDRLDFFCYGLGISIAVRVITRCRKVQLKLDHDETQYHSMCKSICFQRCFERKVFPRASCCAISLKTVIGLWQMLFYYLNDTASFFSVFDLFPNEYILLLLLSFFLFEFTCRTNSFSSPSRSAIVIH